MPHSLAELARLVNGTLSGDGSRMVERAIPLGLARAGDITLIDASDKSRDFAEKTTAAAAVISRRTNHRARFPAGLGLIEVDDIHVAFSAIVRMFRPVRPSRRVGISPQATISPSAQIAPDVDVMTGVVIDDDVVIQSGSTIHSGVYLGPGCKIGRDVTIFPGAALYENVIVGDRAIIHSAVVLGAHGFGYTLVDGRHVLTPQLGYVEIECDVEIGAGTTIDRGTYGPTVVGEGTKIDDQVMIGHNCRIGRHNLICAQVGLAGSTTTGDYVVMAGQVGARDHIHIGDRAVIGAKSGIMYDVPPGQSVVGIPALPMNDWRLLQAVLQKLPELRHQLKQLERTVTELRGEVARQAATIHDRDSSFDQGCSPENKHAA